MFILPGFIIFKLIKIKKRNLLNDPNTIFTYGYLFNLYKKNFYYWDFVILSRRFLISIVIIIFLNQIKEFELYPLIIILIFICIGHYLQIVASPFSKQYSALNLFSRHSLISLILTYSFIIFIFGEKNKHSISVNFYFGFIFIFNLIILFEFIFLYFSKKMILIAKVIIFNL